MLTTAVKQKQNKTTRLDWEAIIASQLPPQYWKMTSGNENQPSKYLCFFKDREQHFCKFCDPKQLKDPFQTTKHRYNLTEILAVDGQFQAIKNRKFEPLNRN